MIFSMSLAHSSQNARKPFLKYALIGLQGLYYTFLLSCPQCNKTLQNAEALPLDTQEVG